MLRAQKNVRGRTCYAGLLLVVAACGHGTAPAPTPAVAASRVAGAVWRRVVIVPAKPHAAVGDTLRFSAMTVHGDVEGEHSLSCAPVWKSLNPERARFLHDGPDGRLVALAPGSATIVATCSTTEGAVTLDIAGKP